MARSPLSRWRNEGQMKRTALLLCFLVCAGGVAAQTPAPSPAPGAPAATPGAGPDGGAGAAGGRRGAPAGPPQPASKPYDFNDHPGWVSMFDGKSLNNWDGPKDIWHVENGAITATGTAANPIGSVYLYW